MSLIQVHFGQFLASNFRKSPIKNYPTLCCISVLYITSFPSLKSSVELFKDFETEYRKLSESDDCAKYMTLDINQISLVPN